MKRILLTVAIMAATLSHGFAQAVCAAPEQILEVTEKQLGQSPYSIGLAGESIPVATFVNNDTKTWSVLVFYPDRICVLASGEDFKVLPSGQPT